ncbi:MAG: glycerol kinase GlpK [Chloroflexi bacterium]|nr:glycerol kinase GlpK [Chloroflexota bacterium]
MTQKFILGIDQGTTGTFVGLMDEAGSFAANSYRTHRQIYPRPGYIEHDPVELWRNVVDQVNEVMTRAGVGSGAIAGIGIANQGESVVLWDAATGTPLYNVIVWQDTRTQESLAPLAADVDIARYVHETTGLRIDAYFSASKIRWLLENVDGVTECLSRGSLRCGTLDTWIIWNLTDGQAYRTDPSTASRTLLFDIHRAIWDDKLLQLFNVPADILPEVVPTTATFGYVQHAAVACRGVPIVTSIVDQPAAMAGHACLDSGMVKATYGTGCFINMNTSDSAVDSPSGLLTMLAWTRNTKTTYGLDGGVLTAGSTLKWLSDKLRFTASPDQIDDLVAGGVDKSPLWIPAQIGLGPPYWARMMRGAWLGIGLETRPADLIYAVLEGIALRVVQIVQTMERDANLTMPSLRVDGGLTHSYALMQLQADLLGRPVEVLADTQATVRGVSSLAARQVGMWTDDHQIGLHAQAARTFEPSISADHREARLNRFARAIDHVIALGQL